MRRLVEWMVPGVFVWSSACALAAPPPTAGKGTSPPDTALVIEATIASFAGDTASWADTRAQLSTLIRSLRPGDELVLRLVRDSSYGPPLAALTLPRVEQRTNNPYDTGELLRQRSAGASRDSAVAHTLALLDTVKRLRPPRQGDLYGSLLAAAEELALPRNSQRHRVMLVLSDVDGQGEQATGMVLPPRVTVWVGGLRGGFGSVVAAHARWRASVTAAGAAAVYFLPPGERLNRELLTSAGDESARAQGPLAAAGRER